MSWAFVEEALKSLGFSEAWIHWIMAAIENPRFGIKINGEITHWINGKAGLRQGYPLSPSLFIICAEVLSRMIRHEECLGSICGLRASPSSTPVTHLFFMLFFSNASVDHCGRLMAYMLFLWEVTLI